MGSMKKTSRFKEGDKVKHKEDNLGTGTVVSRSGNTVGVRWKSGQRSHDHNMLKKEGLEEVEDPLGYYRDEEERMPYDYDGDEDDLDYELRDKLRALRKRDKEAAKKKGMKESMTDAEKKELEKISDELEGASKMHANQSKRVKKIADSSKEISENEEKNCGCGKDPCITYGVQSESSESEIEEYGEYGKKKKKKNLKNSLYESRDSRLYNKLLTKWTKK